MASSDQDIRTLRSVSIGLIAGVLMFLAMALFLRQSLHPTGLNVVGYLACCWALVSVPIADVLRSARSPTTTPEQDPQYWKKRINAQLVSMGIVEGAALFCCVSLIISGLWWPFAALLAPVGAMLAWFPRDS